jgi:hypothetical protein
MACYKDFRELAKNEEHTWDLFLIALQFWSWHFPVCCQNQAEKFSRAKISTNQREKFGCLFVMLFCLTINIIGTIWILTVCWILITTKALEVPFHHNNLSLHQLSRSSSRQQRPAERALSDLLDPRTSTPRTKRQSSHYSFCLHSIPTFVWYLFEQFVLTFWFNSLIVWSLTRSIQKVVL